MKRRGIPSLTGIRGVAAVWVMLFHMQQNAGKYLGLPRLENLPLLTSGWRGVDLFFILSGFILMYAHESDFLQIRKEGLLRFAELRFTRVYPLNTVVLALITVLVASQPDFVLWFRAVHNPHDFTVVPFIKTLFLATHWYLPGTGDWNEPVWSLSLEILGYVAFPLLAHYAARVRSARGAIFVVLGSYALYVAALASAHDINLNAIATVAIARMFFAFIIGIAIYRLWIITEKSAEKFATWIGVISVLVVLAVSLFPQAGVVMDLAFASLLFSLASQRGWINAILASEPVVFLGKISFPLYLVHAVPMAWVRYLCIQHAGVWSSSERALVVAAWAVGSILLATALHYGVERPVHRLARQWANRKKAAVATANATA